MNAVTQPAEAPRPDPLTRNLLTGGGVVLVSAIVHLIALFGVGGYLVYLDGIEEELVEEEEIEEEPPNQVVINLEELIPKEIVEVKPPEPQPRPTVDVFPDQESPVKPENAPFDSDKNSIAMTDNPVVDPDGPPVPSQDGEDLPGVSLRERRFVDAPEDQEIQPKSAAAPEGARPAPRARLRPPQAESKNPQLVAEAPPVESAPKESPFFDVRSQHFLENPAESEAEEGKPSELENGEEGGAKETVEMAKIDTEKVRSGFADELDAIDEGRKAQPDVEDAMPQKNPDANEPTQPVATMPVPKPNAPIVPTPISQPQEAPAVPMTPGAKPSVDQPGEADAVAFNPERYRNELRGSISNRGDKSSLDAESTPIGAYKLQVNRAISRRWHILVQDNMQFISFSSLKVKFEVDQRGKVQNLRILHEDSGAVTTGISLQAIQTADIPPMPKEIYTLLGNDNLNVVYDFIIF